MKAYILTLGCKVNQYESQAMLEELCRSGFAPAETEEEADVVILNSCTVTAASDQKMRKLLHRARRKNPQALLVLTGCMPQAFPGGSRQAAGTRSGFGNVQSKGAGAVCSEGPGEPPPGSEDPALYRKGLLRKPPDSQLSGEDPGFFEDTGWMQPVLFLLYYSLFPGKSAVKALGRAYPGGPDSGGVRLPGNCSHRNQSVLLRTG